MEKNMRKLNEKWIKEGIGWCFDMDRDDIRDRIRLPSIGYVDDFILLANSKKYLEDTLVILAEDGLIAGIEKTIWMRNAESIRADRGTNRKKDVGICSSKTDPHHVKHSERMFIKIQGEIVHETDEIVFLGRKNQYKYRSVRHNQL